MNTLNKNYNGYMFKDDLITNKNTLYIETKFMDDIFLVVVKGEHTSESAKSTFLEMFDALEKNENIYRVLIDCRDIKNPIIDPMKTFEYAKAVAKECLNRQLHPKLAYLYTPTTDMNLHQFGKIAAENRGVYADIFNNYNSAISWLKDT